MDSTIKLLRMMIPMLLSMRIYFQLDKNFKLTNKINSQLKIKSEWQANYIVANMLLLLLILGLLFTYIMYIPENLYDILNGLIIGINLAICTNLTK